MYGFQVCERTIQRWWKIIMMWYCRSGVANLWRMRHTWRIGNLKVAQCTFFMTSHFYSLIFFLFAFHRYFSVENRTSEGVKTFFYFLLSTDIVSGKQDVWGHRRTQGSHCAMPPPLWPYNKVLIPNFQSIISQTNNDCSLLSLVLAKLLFLDISCENIFGLSVVTALTARPFPIKKCAKMSFFFFFY